MQYFYLCIVIHISESHGHDHDMIIKVKLTACYQPHPKVTVLQYYITTYLVINLIEVKKKKIPLLWPHDFSSIKMEDVWFLKQQIASKFTSILRKLSTYYNPALYETRPVCNLGNEWKYLSKFNLTNFFYYTFFYSS